MLHLLSVYELNFYNFKFVINEEKINNFNFIIYLIHFKRTSTKFFNVQSMYYNFSIKILLTQKIGFIFNKLIMK